MPAAVPTPLAAKARSRRRTVGPWGQQRTAERRIDRNVWRLGRNRESHGFVIGRDDAPEIGHRTALNWSRQFGQDDKWSLCLTAAIIAVNRRDYEQTTPPEPLSGRRARDLWRSGAFPPDRTDPPFTISVLPRRSRRGWPIPNAHRPKAADEDVTVDGVAVTNDVSRRD